MALTQVFTDQGIVGIGEGTPYEHPLVIKKYTEEYIKPLLLGQNPFDVEYLTCNGFNRRERAPWAGVDNALWDIIGKAVGLPVFRILDLEGDAEPRVHIYASGGDNQPWYANGEENLINEALSYKENGYDLFKFRRGTTWKRSGMTFQKYRPIMERLREAVGPEFRLVHETTNGTGLSLDQVINDFCPMLEDLGFYWFEDPIGRPEDYGRVREALDTVMVSGHFGQTNRFDVKEWIDRDWVDITQMDCNIGGITECFYVAHSGALKGKIHCPHNWHGGFTTMSNAHLTAAIPNRHYCELNQTFNPLKEEVFKEPLTVKNGWMELPEKPGYGVEIIDDFEKKFPYVPGTYHRPNPNLLPG